MTGARGRGGDWVRGNRAGAEPRRRPAPPTPKASAPIDLTGYWVAFVSEDWRFRMVTPPKGDYTRVPLTPEGRKVAAGWDPAADEAAGNKCKAFGGAAIMRVPGRLHVTWQDDTTLRVDTDAGMQTRIFRFAAAPPQAAPPSWQGQSTARWEFQAVPRRGDQDLVGRPSNRRRGIADRGDHQPAPGIPALERRPVQREHDGHRALRPRPAPRRVGRCSSSRRSSRIRGTCSAPTSSVRNSRRRRTARDGIQRHAPRDGNRPRRPGGAAAVSVRRCAPPSRSSIWSGRGTRPGTKTSRVTGCPWITRDTRSPRRRAREGCPIPSRSCR